GSVFQDVRDAIGVKLTDFKSVFQSVREAIGGTNPFGSVFQDVRDAIGVKLTDFKSVFQSVREAIGGTNPFGNVYDKVSTNWLFGDKPWMKQTVARDMASAVAGYKFSLGQPINTFRNMINKCAAEFKTIRKYTDVAISSTSGLIIGTIAAPLTAIGQAIGGLVTGCKNAGFPGLVIGTFVGLGYGLAFPFRNIYNSYINATTDIPLDSSSSTDNRPTNWALIKSDASKVSQSTTKVNQYLMGLFQQNHESQVQSRNPDYGPRERLLDPA
ncbi:hypothetical protein DA717_13460, partial [Piscirickettsiaceae bacterium NZ-RLO2]